MSMAPVPFGTNTESPKLRVTMLALPVLIDGADPSSFEEQNDNIFALRSGRAGYAGSKRNIPDRDPLVVYQRCAPCCRGERHPQYQS